jgi:tyrosine-protein phosphatase YwqE
LIPHGISIYTHAHTHLLPGLDDGVETIEESLEFAAAMVGGGLTKRRLDTARPRRHLDGC